MTVAIVVIGGVVVVEPHVLLGQFVITLVGDVNVTEFGLEAVVV